MYFDRPILHQIDAFACAARRVISSPRRNNTDVHRIIVHQIDAFAYAVLRVISSPVWDNTRICIAQIYINLMPLRVQRYL